MIRVSYFICALTFMSLSLFPACAEEQAPSAPDTQNGASYENLPAEENDADEYPNQASTQNPDGDDVEETEGTETEGTETEGTETEGTETEGTETEGTETEGTEMESGGTEMAQITVNVHMVLLQSDHAESLHCTLTDEELQSRYDEINAIWAQANIQFQFEPAIRIAAQNQGQYLQALQSENMPLMPAIKNTIPPATFNESTWKMVLVEDLGNNPPGVYSCNEGLLISSQYFGHQDNIVPATVWAHELGHSLGLPHLCGQGENLMCADGTQPEVLFEEQIEIARAQATTGSPHDCQ
jgi:hypothetical protein